MTTAIETGVAAEDSKESDTTTTMTVEEGRLVAVAEVTVVEEVTIVEEEFSSLK